MGTLLRAVAGVTAGLLLATLAPLTPAAPVAAAAPWSPVWRITESVGNVSIGQPGAVSGNVPCPTGQSVVGGDIRNVSRPDLTLVKAAYPVPSIDAFLWAVQVVPDEFSAPVVTFRVVAYCVADALVQGLVTVEKFFQLPQGTSTGWGGGTVGCPSDHLAVGGGSMVYNYADLNSGYVGTSSATMAGITWYAAAYLNQTSILIEVLCLRTAAVPPKVLATKVLQNPQAYPVSLSGSAVCPDRTRALTGGAYQSVIGQGAIETDPAQNRALESYSAYRDWVASVRLSPGYEALIVVWCIHDADPPSVGFTGPIQSPAQRVILGSTLSLPFAGSDNGDPVERFQVRWRRAAWNSGFGGWQYPAAWSGLTHGPVTATGLQRGFTYCYGLRAQDAAGNWSAWVSRCAARPLDDRALVASSGWTNGTSPAEYAGTFRRSSILNAKLSLANARFSQLALVAVTCPSCGKVRVLVAGTAIATLNLASSATLHRQIILLPAGTSTTANVVLKVVTSGKPVIIDGLAVIP